MPKRIPIEEQIASHHFNEKGEEAEAFDNSQQNINARTEVVKTGSMKLALLPKKNRGETVTVEIRLNIGNDAALKGKQLEKTLLEMMLT